MTATLTTTIDPTIEDTTPDVEVATVPDECPFGGAHELDTWRETAEFVTEYCVRCYEDFSGYVAERRHRR